MLNRNNCITNLIVAGISADDAYALRRISMTLHRWHELECGDGNSYGSWCITRGKQVPIVHFRDDNPWHDRAIYVPYRRWLTCTSFRAVALVDAGISEDRIDCYFLRQPNGEMQAGLRYGVAAAYYSPMVTNQKAAAALALEYSDDGRPYLEHHHYRHGQGKDSTTYTPLADRERGAIKRLDKIMARYPGFARYIQTDPRGCALYILRPEDVPTEKLYRKLPDGSMIRDVDAISSCYTRGIAVFK